MKFTVTSAAQTKKIAIALAKKMRGGEVLALYGDLGAGKTTFAQAFAEALGVKERVQSPTFILMHEHRVARAKSAVKIFLHADAYRGDAAQFRSIGLPEYLGATGTVALIEWAERVEGLLPKRRINVRFRHRGGDRRDVTVTGA